MPGDRFHPAARGPRSVRRTARWKFWAALLPALGLAIGAIWLAPRSDTSGQVQATSTPIRLTQVTPVAPRSPTATAEAIVIVVEDDADEGPVSAEIDVEFEADDWEGGLYRGNAEWYGRAWTAVYGAASTYPEATLSFELDQAPEADLVLTVEGLDDELAARNPIAIEVNGERVFEGESPFADWDANTANTGADADWTTGEITLPAELFDEGENEITFLNLSDSANVGLPPYILLSEATLVSVD
jgi:hypothetical protein